MSVIFGCKEFGMGVICRKYYTQNCGMQRDIVGQVETKNPRKHLIYGGFRDVQGCPETV
jgi:hypothetical protein